MELALYDPDGGYYRVARQRPGRAGDFLTAPETHPIFGAALAARCVDDVWRRLGRPAPFVVREYGAGDGRPGRRRSSTRLARTRPDLAGGASATSRSRSSRAGSTRSRARLADGRASRRACDARPTPIARSTASSSPTRSSTPCRSTASSARRAARELLVGVGRRRASSTSRPTRRRRPWPSGSRPRASCWPTARRAEICLALDALGRARRPPASTAASLLLIDYGYPAAELYDPSGAATARCGPTCATASTTTRIAVGRQDLTAHVDVDRGRAGGRRRRPDAPRPDHPGRVPRRARHGGAAAGDPGRPGDDDGGLPRRPRRRSCACSTRRRWAASGSWPSVGLAGRAAPRGPPARPVRATADRALTGPQPTGLGRCALLPRGPADAHASLVGPRPTRRGAAREPARALGARRSPTSPDTRRDRATRPSTSRRPAPAPRPSPLVECAL